MIAFVLTHKTYTNVVGIVVVHDTKEPVLVASTPLSQILLSKYIEGFKFFEYDNTAHKRVERRVPPKNYDKFLLYCPSYFSYGDMVLEQMPCQGKTLTVHGVTYELKEITNATTTSTK